jgi:hypothetical protein
VESITAAIEEIKKEFGQTAANKAMADIITGTEKAVTAEAIAGAINGVLKSLAEANEETINDPLVTREEYEAALKMKEQLQSFVTKLNDGSANEDGSAGSGLNEALNGYFDLPPDSHKYFTEDYAWVSPSEKAADEEYDSQKGFKLSVKELGRETLQGFADFLRTEVGSEEAARYIESLGDDDDIFDAADYVRTLLMKNTYVKDSDAESIRRFGANFPTREGEGVEQIGKVTYYLGTTMIDAVNGLIRNNADIKARMQAVTTPFDGDLNQSDTYGLYRWPGAFVAGGRLCDWQWGGRDGNGLPGWAFFDELGDTIGADRFLRQMEYEVDGERRPCVYQPPSSTGTLVDKEA